MQTLNNILELIGKTPLVRINKLAPKNGATVYAKLEGQNPGGSVKDRMALYIIENAEAAGKLDKSKIILEATSGNTGIALAMIAAVKGHKLALTMPESVSIERRKIIKAYGAELILSPAAQGTGGAVELKKKLLVETPDKYVALDQFSDPSNILAHYQTTGREILEDTEGKIDTFVASVGTAGTGVGVAMRLKEYNQNIRTVGVMPMLGVPIQGLRNPKEMNPTQLFRREWFDEVIELDKAGAEAGFETARKLASEEGIFVGMSSGAAMKVALDEAKKLGKGKTVVVIIPDRGDKYLSTDLFTCKELFNCDEKCDDKKECK
ncbi:MAG: PLP-dependent cysteine synthase family protein [Nanoarchaeota archaeon]|nr:PLP-dependent cysteine synthase family protein [Nanoarchaeota archaeon]MBU4451334.1 PLP-dependent cysteine synthase family protein [Nanoarchaeota archaeon]MCG2723737.1 PLP-dependent cysteine synthase family protein [archaeon]